MEQISDRELKTKIPSKELIEDCFNFKMPDLANNEIELLNKYKNMEIYTGDLITLAQECAERITSNVGYTGYFIEDELCNLQRDIRNKIRERLSDSFNYLIEREKIEDIEHAYLKDNLKEKLFKIINEL